MWNTGPTIKIMNILWECWDHCTSNVKLVSTRIKLKKWVGIFFAVKIIAMNSEPASGFQLNITHGKGIPHLLGQSLVLNERIYLMSNGYIHPHISHNPTHLWDYKIWLVWTKFFLIKVSHLSDLCFPLIVMSYVLPRRKAWLNEHYLFSQNITSPIPS